MTALQAETSTPSSAAGDSSSKNPYNTRRKSLYFSPATHSATLVDSTTTTTAQPPLPTAPAKHLAQNPEQNPRSPKRIRRLVHVDRSFTPPPSPPSAGAAATAPSSAPLAQPHPPHQPPPQAPAPADIDSLEYDEEDDPVINAIIHILQLSDNTPLSTRDLSSSILEYRLCSLDSPNPSSVVSSRITSHLKRRAAEKPPREPLLTRYESENGRKRTEYYLKYPDLLSDRSKLYDKAATTDQTKVLQSVPASKLNILSSDVLDMLDPDDYDSEDISNRSPDRPTLFDPPSGVTLSPDHQSYDNLLGNSMMVDIDVPTGIKLDYEFFVETVPAVPLDNLTPPSEEVSYPNTPLREVFSRRASPATAAEDVELTTPPAANDDVEPDDPQSPHSGASNGPNTLLPPAFYDSPLIYHSMALSQTQTEEVEMFEPGEEDGDDDEVRVVEMRAEHNAKHARMWVHESEDFGSWDAKKEDGHVPSPEKVGMDELEEWLEGI